MNLNEVKKHVIFQCIFVTFVIVCMAFTIFWLLTENVSAASDYHNVITNAIYTGTSNCVTNQTGLCVADTSSVNYGRYQLGSGDIYSNVLTLNFTYNSSIRANVNATIRLTGKNWANVNYVCQSNIFTNCRVVRASSTILNVNFSNTRTSAVTYPEFFITTENGSFLNTNNTFNVTKADLYETLINNSTGGSSSSSNADIINNQNQNTQDIINNQNESTEDIINNNNANTQDIINNDNSNFSNLISNITNNLYPSCENGYRNFLVGSDKSYLANTSGQVNANSSYFVSEPIRIFPGNSYTVNILNATNIQYGYYCFYSSTGSRVGNCVKYDDNTTTSYNFTPPSGSYFVRFTLYRNNNVMLNANLKGYTCVRSDYENNRTEFANYLSNSAVNDFIQDDSDPNIDDSEIEDTLSLVSVDDPLGYLATLPLTLLAKINTQLSSNTCTEFNLGHFGFSNYEFKLPCIQPERYLGNTIWTFIDLIVSVGLLSISVYKLHHTITNFLGMGSENEVNSYSAYWSPMEFLMIIVGGEKGYNAAYDRHFGGDD